MTSQEVNAAIRESLGLPPKPESQPTVPQATSIFSSILASVISSGKTI